MSKFQAPRLEALWINVSGFRERDHVANQQEPTDLISYIGRTGRI